MLEIAANLREESYFEQSLSQIRKMLFNHW